MKMPFGLIGLMAIAAAVPATGAPLSQAAGVFSCRTEDMRDGKPIVTSPQTAKAIFLAVEDDLFPAANKTEYPEIVAEDDGAGWSVFRHRPAERVPDGGLQIARGGGQLSLKIAKCDARVSAVWLSR